MDKPDKKKNRSYRLSLQDATSHERIWSLRFSHKTMVAALVTHKQRAAHKAARFFFYTSTLLHGYPLYTLYTANY